MDLKIDLREVEKAFASLPRSTRNKALRPALREGAGVIQRAAVANVNAITEEESTGVLARNIVVRSYKKKNGRLRAGVQIRKGAVNPAKRDKNGPVRVATYGAVLEYGKEGQPPKSWIRKAAREKAQAAIDAVTSGARKRMADAVRDAKP